MSRKNQSLADIGGQVTPIYGDDTKSNDEKSKSIGQQIKDYTCTGFFWLFIIIVVFVLVTIWFIGQPNSAWFNDLSMPKWGKGNGVAFYVVTVLTALTMAIGSYISFMMASEPYKIWIFLTYFAAMVGLVIWFAVFYQQKNLPGAFYIACGLFILSVIQVLTTWVGLKEGAYAVIPYAAWLFLSLFFLYYIMVNNPIA